MRMFTSRVKEAQTSGSEQHNPGEATVDQLFGQLGAALSQWSREKTTEFLSSRGDKEEPIVAEGRPVLEVVMGREALDTFSTALRRAPQGPLTEDLFALIVRHQGEFTQSAQQMYPEDPNEERQLAELVRALRASLHPTPRR